jgi:SAM-dependent methyltransferase
MSILVDRYWDFLSLREACPQPGYLEVEPDWREALPGRIGASGRLLRQSLEHAASVLDVGAGNRHTKRVLEGLGVEAAYRSADISKADEPHEFGDFLAVEDRFDAIVMQELLEHLPVDLGVSFMEHAHRLLTPGGVLWITTPNARHPNQVWRYDVTHIRPWPYHDLHGVLRLIGFTSVQGYRQFVRPPSWKRRLTTPVSKALHAIMELDHAQSLIMVATK